MARNGTALAVVDQQKAAVLEQVVVQGDLSKLQPAERVAYYKTVCESVGLNPFTKPFEYITLNGKLTLYAKRDATDQLRSINGVSVEITSREMHDNGIYVVTARAKDRNGRTDEAIGAVSIANLKGDALANAIMKAECVPLDSEILTRDGWKTYDQLQIGEEVLAYDCETDTCRWVPLLNVTIREKLPMARLYTEEGQFEVFCTPDHSWAVEKAGYRVRSTGVRGPRGPYKNRRPDRMLVKACEINSGHRLVLAAPEVGVSEGLLTPVEAAILGWAVWYLPAEISRLILERAGFRDRSDLPRIVTRLSPPARKAMLQAMMMAEGDARGNFANADRHILDAFQILCVLEGIAVVGQEHQRPGVVVIRKKKTRHVAGSFLRLELIGEQPAWCPTTPLGTWVMRQNGRVMITGNTKAKRRVTLSICGLGWLDETEVATVPDATAVDVDMETGEIKSPMKNVTPPKSESPSRNNAAPKGGDESKREDYHVELLGYLKSTHNVSEIDYMSFIDYHCQGHPKTCDIDRLAELARYAFAAGKRKSQSAAQRIAALVDEWRKASGAATTSSRRR